jgi:hypothetical protein
MARTPCDDRRIGFIDNETQAPKHSSAVWAPHLRANNVYLHASGKNIEVVEVQRELKPSCAGAEHHA